VLLGGETAEMPGFYADGEYDVAGFIVGVVDRGKIIDGSRIAPGDIVLGLPSAGLHTNGYSLARKLFFETSAYKPDTFVGELGQTIGEALLQTHLSYLSVLGPLLDTGVIKGLAHITGGGLRENIPRILPDGTAVEIKRDSWPILPIFKLMQSLGNIDEGEMFRTFNMGVGMVMMVAAADASAIRNDLGSAYEIGRVTSGSKTVTLV
jgi:phosphoribosylformylglycinamidine cyclo-ligase